MIPNMNNPSDIPFNFANMDGLSGNFGGSAMADGPQQVLGGGGMDQQVFNDGNNFNLVQSMLLQGQQQQQNSQGSTPQLPQDAQVMSSNQVSNQQGGGACWQTCRFCQQKYFATAERLLQHEISCPTHLQVQQFLQQQQMGGFNNQQANQMQQNQSQQSQNQGNDSNQGLPNLQAQLQMQQNQLQQQFSQQSNQFANNQMFGGNQGLQGLSQFMTGNQSNDFQGLNGLQQAQLEQSFQQAQQGNQMDQFESAIDRLPAFNQAQQQQQVQARPPIQPPRQYAEPKELVPSGPDSATDYFPLALPEDEEWLTPLHCFVRRYCVEVFVATPEDVAAPCMGKRNPVSVNQVGIRCPYCSPERMEGNDQVDIARARENGVVYPSLISRIYNSSINLLQRHLRSCAFVPPEILGRYEELKSSNARSGASKKYWADSAARLGLVDTPDGIRLDKEVHEAYKTAQANPKKAEESQAPPLVLPSDKRNTTAFTFHLMSQMQPCVFTEADRLGRRRGLKVGFAGLACRHCFGVYGSGRFFPSSVKTMADASKTLDVIYRHVMKCKNCPCDIKGGLRNLRDFHDSERSKMPFGNQRAFFVKIWGRLHEGSADLIANGAAPNPAVPPAPPALPAAAQAAVAEAQQQQENMKMPAKPEGLQNLYALVKRESETVEADPNKLATEAA